LSLVDYLSNLHNKGQGLFTRLTVMFFIHIKLTARLNVYIILIKSYINLKSFDILHSKMNNDLRHLIKMFN